MRGALALLPALAATRIAALTVTHSTRNSRYLPAFLGAVSARAPARAAPRPRKAPVAARARRGACAGYHAAARPSTRRGRAGLLGAEKSAAIGPPADVACGAGCASADRRAHGVRGVAGLGTDGGGGASGGYPAGACAHCARKCLNVSFSRTQSSIH
jgi:hypothetical protein